MTTAEAIENLQRQLAAAREDLKDAEERTAIAIEALMNAMKTLKHAQEKALKDAEERTAIAIKALKDAQEKDAAEYMTIAIKALNDAQEQVAATANPGALPPEPMPPMPPIGLRTEVELRSIYLLLDTLTMTQCRPVPPIEIRRIADEVASIKSMLKKLTETEQEEEQQKEEQQMFAIVPVSGLNHIIAPYGTTIRASAFNQIMPFSGNKFRKFTAGVRHRDHWSDDEDFDPVGEPETDDGDSGEAQQVLAVDKGGVVHICSLQKMLTGRRDEQEPLCKKARTETTASSPSD